jgi:hypothetical protein
VGGAAGSGGIVVDRDGAAGSSGGKDGSVPPPKSDGSSGDAGSADASPGDARSADAGDGAPGQIDIPTGTVPPNPGGIFDPGTHTVVTGDPNKTPALVYPVSDTMFPQNVYRVLFQWKKAGLTLFQLSFDSPVLKVNVYTDGVHSTCTQAATGGSCWESDVTSWGYLAASNAGQAITFKIRGVDSPTAKIIYESPAYTIRFSKKPVPGAIYYWSTTAQGVRRGAMGDPSPQNFLTPNEAQGKCVACHTLSRNGKRLAADVGGETLTVVDVVQTVPPPVEFGSIGTPTLKINNSWATFNPDTSRVVASKQGILKLLDGKTGAGIGPNGGTIPLGSGVLAAQPDWAPDGNHLVFSAGNVDRGGATSIGWFAVSGDTFSGLQTVVAPNGTQRYGYPMFNPTSDWIAFVRGAKIEKDLTDQILVTQAQPGAPLQELVRANTLVNDTTVATGIENNMPTWAPSAAPDTQWVAFASQRDYGYVLRQGSKYGVQRQQLWIAAIDTDKLGSGDPSFPAFRVPFQELTEDCHRPFWAEDALNPPPPPDAGPPPPPPADADPPPPPPDADPPPPDAGPPDVSPPCVGQDGDCSSGVCCASLQCQPDTTGTIYTCQPPIK